MAALAYFITFHTYETWLHGHQEGSVDDAHNGVGQPLLPPSARRERFRRAQLRHDPITLDSRQRFVVESTIREVCLHRAWRLEAVNVRSTHVHVIAAAPQPPERVMNDIKAYATRRLRESGAIECDLYPWAEHGSTQYLNDQESLARAIHYVLHEQGAALAQECPPGWTPKA